MADTLGGRVSAAIQPSSEQQLIGDLWETLQAAQPELVAAQEQLAQARAILAANNVAASLAQTQIVNLQSQVQSLNAQVASLKAQLAAVTPPVPVPAPVPAPAGSPVIQVASGNFAHKTNVILSGANFGTKTQAAPVIWDDASGASPLSTGWSDAWPNKNPTFALAYRAPQRGVAPAHSHVTRYLAGAHANTSAGGFDDGWNVIPFKNRTLTTFPAFTYASWYQQYDPAWAFGGDDNLKLWATSKCCSPYELPDNWYISYTDGPHSKTDSKSYQLNDDKVGPSTTTFEFLNLQDPDANGHPHWWQNAGNPFGVWRKLEVEIKYSKASDGFIRMREDGVLKINYAGRTAILVSNNITEGIGGYGRVINPNNWRYFNDLYLDYSLSRVVLANNPDLAKATLIEPQISTSWSDTSIGITVNVGRLPPGQAWAFVVDRNGKPGTAFAISIQ